MDGTFLISMNLKQTLTELDLLANPEKVHFKQKKFGVIANRSLGIYHSDLKVLAKKIGHQPDLAIALIHTEIYEARLLASKILKPADVTEQQMDLWITQFENWEVCDSYCMGLFSKTEYAFQKIMDWSTRENEFERRAAFATLSSYCMANKKADNGHFELFFPLIINAATDPRLYVKKAVNWALRSLGKRNIDLHKRALEVATEILEFDSKSAKWVASDAIKQLNASRVNILDYPRSIYRP
jgi:3-methyladenine DNA glycosylase AlkD